MKRLPSPDRPREKLARHGLRVLGDNEVLALVLGSGARGADALAVADALLVARGGIHGLARSGCEELSQAYGIGRARAAQLVAAIELGRRSVAHPPAERALVAAPRDAAALLIPAYGACRTEQFGVVLLDTRQRIIRTAVLAIGSLNSAGVEPREVFREAVLAGAAAIILFHNHPSGDPRPSRDDEALTGRLVAAGTLMGIEVVDHIIVGETRYCSFRESGRLPAPL